MKLGLAIAASLWAGTAGAATTTPTRSCRAEIGREASSALVSRCIQVSPATHPPCNSANPCKLIRNEIVRSCATPGIHAARVCRKR
ncbi:MAG: hypothetical protein E6G94_02320 [Alphaproteobacteria bacterium]|nr:MAG: hypothetical protein E6G94_02320 [Alphaproteobacteria bacterium]